MSKVFDADGARERTARGSHTDALFTGHMPPAVFVKAEAPRVATPPGDGADVMIDRRRRATLRIYASAVRRGVRVPKMLTVDEEFERIVAEVRPTAKMRPLEEPEPGKDASGEESPSEETPPQEQ